MTEVGRKVCFCLGNESRFNVIEKSKYGQFFVSLLSLESFSFLGQYPLGALGGQLRTGADNPGGGILMWYKHLVDTWGTGGHLADNYFTF